MISVGPGCCCNDQPPVPCVCGNPDTFPPTLYLNDGTGAAVRMDLVAAPAFGSPNWQSAAISRRGQNVQYQFFCRTVAGGGQILYFFDAFVYISGGTAATSVPPSGSDNQTRVTACNSRTFTANGNLYRFAFNFLFGVYYGVAGTASVPFTVTSTP